VKSFGFISLVFDILIESASWYLILEFHKFHIYSVLVPQMKSAV
jgi:hypothetical protein